MFGIHRYGEDAPNFGKKHSQEARDAISKARKGTKRQYLPDGSFIMVKP